METRTVAWSAPGHDPELGVRATEPESSKSGGARILGPLSDNDYGYVIYGDDTDRWLDDDDEYEAFALDYATMEAHRDDN